MCRVNGRRCPACEDPMKVAARNARRRAAHGKKNGNGSHAFKALGRTRLKNFEAESDAFNEMMSEDEQDAIRGYTEADYSDIKDYLYQSSIDGDAMEYDFEDMARLETQIAHIDAALEKAPIPEKPRPLYRGVIIPDHVDNIDEWLDRGYPEGGVIKKKGYLSTSLDPTVALKEYAGLENPNDENRQSVVMFEFISKKGAPIGNASSEYENEREVLVQRDSRFKVDSVSKDVPFTFNGEQGTKKITIVRLIDAD